MNLEIQCRYCKKKKNSQEAKQVAVLIKDKESPVKRHFFLVEEGAQVSSLDVMTPNHAEYWTALEDFLKQLELQEEAFLY